MDHACFDGVYDGAYGLFTEGLLFPNVRYVKVVERLNRDEKLLKECSILFKLGGGVVVD